jgi:hypothetical protein
MLWSSGAPERTPVVSREYNEVTTMRDYELGEVQPGDQLQGPITLDNINATLAAQRHTNTAVRLGIGLAVIAGLVFLARKAKT